MRVEVTTPITSLRASFFCAVCVVLSAILLVPRFSAHFTFAQNGLDASDVFSQSADLFKAFGLPHLELEAQPEKLIGQISLLVLQLDFGCIANFVSLHISLSIKIPLLSAKRLRVPLARHKRRAQRQLM